MMINNEREQMKQVRQGDVLLVAVETTPKGAQAIPLECGRIVLMHGEVTGHAHAIAEVSKAKLLDFKAERFLQIAEKTALAHEEHTAIFLEKGTYRQVFQFEEKREEIKRVTD